MPVRVLPPNPNLDHLKHQANDLRREHAARLPDAAQRLREFHPRFTHVADVDIFNATLHLSDAQLTIAREHGFPSWTRLRRHIEKPTLADRLDLLHHERIEDPIFRRAVDLIDAGNAEELRELLKRHPILVHQRVLFEGGNYFRTPTLLEFIAENPIRHRTLPGNIVDVARVILEAGPDLASRNEALMLVATGCVVRECKVQRPLIDLLCAYGADPNGAARSAAVLNEHDAVRALMQHGAKIDLPIAAALGLAKDFEKLVGTASPEGRHLALAVAVQFNHADIVQRLLEAGEDPSRYNPLGGHSHGTPLHHAAGGGYMAVVRLLVAHGARLDLKDMLWHGTPADWAAHEGKTEVEAYLRQREAEATASSADAG